MTNTPLIIAPRAIIIVISPTIRLLVTIDTDKQHPAMIATEVMIDTPLSHSALYAASFAGMISRLRWYLTVYKIA